MPAPTKTAAKTAMLALAAQSPDSGIVDLCAQAGIHHSTHYEWCRSDPGYAETFAAIREGKLDSIESNVLAELARRSTPEMLTALPMPWLLALGGYLHKALNRVQRSEVRHTGQVRHTHAYEDMSLEEAQAELDRRLRLRQHRQGALRN